MSGMQMLDSTDSRSSPKGDPGRVKDEPLS